MTPAPSTATSIVSASDLDEPMHDADAFEFSDVEVEEPIQKRTRSNSRMKDSSMPPEGPPQKQTKVRRGAKKVDAEAAAKKPRKRRVIREETIDINTDDE
jgi:hypothetical protein